jgi:tetratricopeptide (TPR) repeat protein
MSEPTRSTLVERARDAAGRGEWQQAHELLAKADAAAPLGGADLALLADVAYAVGHLDQTIGAWERAHAEAARAGDRLAAAGAAVRVAMHLLFDTALMAPVRGWVSRAERLLEGHEETPVHAWLAVVRNYERLLSGDFASARHWARRAIEIGALCDPAAAAIGRVAEARSLILEGDVRRGLELLDEAGVAAVSGELEPIFTGLVYCELVCALQAVGQYDLAEQWTVAMERWRHGKPVGSLHGRCRVHRAEILRLRGSWVEAEHEAATACEELRPYLRRELGWPLTELGRIRLRRGNVEGAEQAFRAAHAAGWDPQPGLALVDLAKGEVARAASSIREALEHPVEVPSKELPPHTELRRVPLLEAQVEAEVAAGDLGRARAAAEELSRVAEQFESKALAASAALARGRVAQAEGDEAAACRHFEGAVQLWSEVGAPYETALARMGLAQALRAVGSEDRGAFELEAAQAGFAAVGAVDRAAEADRARGPAGRDDARGRRRLPAAERGAASGGEQVFCREGDYWLLEFEGRAVRLRDLKGMRYLARLLGGPGRELHVLDLVSGEVGLAVVPAQGSARGLALAVERDAGPLLDGRAKEVYRRRLAEIDEDLEDARATGNDERAAQAEAERDWLARELARAVGLGGRDRLAGSASERARASVTRAVRQAIARIATCHPALGQHLDRAVRTGTYCAYLPDARLAQWRL